MDEQWSYVQNKSKQRWLWYSLDKILLKVVAYTFGTRCDSTSESLLKKNRRILRLLFTLQMDGEVMLGY
ncbi:IS1 family transposase [Rickettsia endosymbiont of Cantharis rufa]|uniref:IS1 family transposase n=1 Tax=Rickettsia endosymbiont of Cantharis rufa TaxID=3066248 RepID=UPI0039792608